MHDLIGGLATWTAFGMPTAGTRADRRRISHYVEPVPTVGFGATVGDVPPTIDPAGDVAVPVVAPGGVLVGALDARTTTSLPPTTRVRDVLIAAPATIRPEQPVEEVAAQLQKDGVATVYVTTQGGVLLGVVVADRLHV